MPIVAYRTKVLNSSPTLLPTGSTVDTATDAIWGSGDDELHLKRGPKGEPFYNKDGYEIFTLCRSVEEAEVAFNELKAIPGVEVKTPFQVIDLLRINWRGKLRIEHIAYGSVYIAKNEKNLTASYVEGVVHNPNYPEMTHGGAGWRLACSPVTGFVPLAAALAGVGLLAGILLGRRGK